MICSSRRNKTINQNNKNVRKSKIKIKNRVKKMAKKKRISLVLRMMKF